MSLREDKGITRFIAPLVLGNMLNPLNSTMLATALVSILVSFKQDTGAGVLLIVPLYFTSAIAQPLMGRLCDIFSPYKINLFGFFVILISAFIGVYAQSFTWLIVSRILLGLGTSTAYPSSMTLIKRRYQVLNMEVPGVTLSLIATSAQVSMALGPFLGGILVESFGWKGIFFVNIPMVIIALLLSISKKEAVLVEKGDSDKSAMQIFKDLDPLGVLLFSGLLMLLLVTLLYPTYVYIKIPVMLIVLFLFVKTELYHKKPFIDVRVLRVNTLLNTTFLRQIGLTFVMYSVLYSLGQWMEQTKGLSPSSVGLILLPLSLAAIIMSLVLANSKNYVLMLSIGILCIIGTSLGMFFLTKSSPVYAIIALTGILGAALGIVTIANQLTLLAVAPADQVGVSSGLYRTVGYIGAILAGSAIKHSFKDGATDAGLHSLGIYALISCITIVFFMLPLYYKKKSLAN
jgi:MFS family permease